MPPLSKREMLSKRSLNALKRPPAKPACAVPLPLVCRGQQICEKLCKGSQLGKGAYGTVWSGKLEQNNLAIKLIPLFEQELKYRLAEVKETLDEVYSTFAVNIALEYVPNFVQSYSVHLIEESAEVCSGWLDGNHLAWAIVMERCAGTLTEYKAPDTTACPVLIAMQVFAALYTLAHCFQLCNNDAYGRNILYQEDNVSHLLYCINNQQFLVPTNGVIWKLTDFGLATRSPSHQRRFDHVEKPCTFPSKEHVLLIKDYPRYGRDVAALLQSLLCEFPDSLWVKKSGEFLTATLGSGLLTTSRGLAQFIEHVAAPEFLASAGLPANLLTANLQKCKKLSQQGKLRVCNIQATDPKTMLQEAKQRFSQLEDTALNLIYETDSSSSLSSSSWNLSSDGQSF